MRFFKFINFSTLFKKVKNWRIFKQKWFKIHGGRQFFGRINFPRLQPIFRSVMQIWNLLSQPGMDLPSLEHSSSRPFHSSDRLTSDGRFRGQSSSTGNSSSGNIPSAHGGHGQSRSSGSYPSSQMPFTQSGSSGGGGVGGSGSGHDNIARSLPMSMPFMMPSYPMMVMPQCTSAYAPVKSESSGAFHQRTASSHGGGHTSSAGGRDGAASSQGRPSYGDEGCVPQDGAGHHKVSTASAVYGSGATARGSPSSRTSAVANSAQMSSMQQTFADRSSSLGTNIHYQMAQGVPYAGGYPMDFTFATAAAAQYHTEPPKPEPPQPPKRPLTPYMRFSKSVSMDSISAACRRVRLSAKFNTEPDFESSKFLYQASLE